MFALFLLRLHATPTFAGPNRPQSSPLCNHSFRMYIPFMSTSSYTDLVSTVRKTSMPKLKRGHLPRDGLSDIILPSSFDLAHEDDFQTIATAIYKLSPLQAISLTDVAICSCAPEGREFLSLLILKCIAYIDLGMRQCPEGVDEIVEAFDAGKLNSSDEILVLKAAACCLNFWLHQPKATYLDPATMCFSARESEAYEFMDMYYDHFRTGASLSSPTDIQVHGTIHPIVRATGHDYHQGACLTLFPGLFCHFLSPLHLPPFPV
jgi:hypothetical protein